MAEIDLQNVTTTGRIARELSTDYTRVDRAIELLGIRPVGRFGNVRLFPPDIVEGVRNQLAAIDRAKPSRTVARRRRGGGR